ncbi:MAG: helix-turn-helix transcriptional regulator [Geodermatophilaceae bacterium]
MTVETNDVLDAVGPRLRTLRQQRQETLAGLSAATGISVSTLSRLESGHRRPSLELLLPLARAHRVPLDELVGAPADRRPSGAPHTQKPARHDRRTADPATRTAPGVQDGPAGRAVERSSRSSRLTRATNGCTS